MKKSRLFTAGVLALVLGLVLAGCSTGDDSGGNPGGGNTDVTFSSVFADGSSSQTTTELTLIFSQAISGLSAGDITLSGVSGVSKGTISGSNPYILPISGFSSGGTLNVFVTKSGYNIIGSPQTVTIYYSGSGGGGGGGAPSSPTGVSATALSSSSVSVSWNAVSDATSYDVYFEIGSSSTKNFADNTTGTLYTHTGLTASTTYYYYIKAKNSAGESGYSSYSSASSATTSSSGGGGGGAPSTPTGVTATAQSSTSIRISWNAVPGATSYKIYSPNNPGVNSGFLLLDTVTTTSYTDTYPMAGETWYYRVSAVNSSGQESAQSSSVSATTPGGGGTKPSAPTGVSAAAQSSSSIRLVWTAVTGATSYKIYRMSGPTSTKYLDGTSTTTSFTSTGWPSSTSAYFQVTAVNSAGVESDYSSPVYATTFP